MQKLKELYNKTLQRYHNGVDYIFQHEDEWDKYYPEVEKLADNLEKILIKIRNATKEEISNGFKT